VDVGFFGEFAGWGLRNKVEPGARLFGVLSVRAASLTSNILLTRCYRVDVKHLTRRYCVERELGGHWSSRCAMASIRKQGSSLSALVASDENIITLDADSWAQLEQAMERPPREVSVLVELLRRKPSWD
jgi:hypothetical protein